MNKIVNIHAVRYQELTFQWADAYVDIMKAFRELGYEIFLHPQLHIQTEFDITHTVGLSEDPDAINLYNHTYRQEIKQMGFPLNNTLFVKPTAPAPNYFTIDPLGYACTTSIAYEKPDFEETRYKTFFNTVVKDLISKRENKWSRTNEVNFSKTNREIPEGHVLVLGQMPGDETVQRFSFGNHWLKLQYIVNELKNKHPVVLKLHPTFKSTVGNHKNWDAIYNVILGWAAQGVVVFEEKESLHDILPHTKVAVVENTTAGIECLMHKVPIISYGLPEYHWVTKDLRHLNMLDEYVEDLSWWDGEKAAAWLAWYCTKYQCHNYSSTFNRLEELCSQMQQ
jgi:hypothetical protein